MKRLLLFTLLSLPLCLSLYAQAPHGIQYQAVIRDVNGDPILNAPVSFRFTIESENGNQIYYKETQTTSSNALGGILLVIGGGNVVQGNFETVDWKSGAVRIRVETDPTGGQNYSPFGITSFKSVPYALFAQQAHSLIDDNGNEWVPENDRDEQTLTVNGNQLSISNGNAVVLPGGSGGGDNWGDQIVETNPSLDGDGTLASPLRIASQGATNGQILKWNGNAWIPQADNNTAYVAGNGIAINGTTISNTGDNDNNASNEIQTLSINGNVLSLTNGGMVNLPGASYTAGTGITIAANTISAQNTTALWNANQLRGSNISTQAPVLGQYLQYIVGGWTPTAGPATTWLENTGSIYFNSGNVGIGTSSPASKLQIVGGTIQLEDETIGKFGSNSMEFSCHIIPLVDNNRGLGLSTRRFTSVWATDGTINTSDAREKTNVHNLQYGLKELMQLRPVSFNWIARPETGTKLGLIAQEVEAILPEVVANSQRTPSLNTEPGNENTDRLGMYYSDLIPVLIKAIQEQEVKIEQLQQELHALKKG